MSEDILCIGECMIEFAPAADQAKGLYRQGFAGDTFNTAVYLARLQQRPVHYMTGAGGDAVSERFIARCRAEGLATEHIRRTDGRTLGLYVIETEDNGERHFQYWRGASAAREMLRGLDHDALVARLRPFATIYFSGITLAILPADDRARLIRALAVLKRDGRQRTVAFDPNFRPALWPSASDAANTFRDAASVSTLVLSAWDDNLALFGATGPEDAVSRWLAWCGGTVVVRVGVDASLVAAFQSDAVTVETTARADPLDTTGGGDSYNAGFISAILDGMALSDAARLGHRIAGHVVGCPGAIIDRSAWWTLFPNHEIEVQRL